MVRVFARVAYDNQRPFTTTAATAADAGAALQSTGVRNPALGEAPPLQEGTRFLKETSYAPDHPPAPERWRALRIAGTLSQTPYQPWANCAPEIRRE